MKRCCRCKIEKPLGDFYLKRASPDRHGARCKVCDLEASKAAAERRKERMAADPVYAAKVQGWGRDWRRRMRDVRYSVEHGTVEALEVAQNGRCATCGRTADEVACAGKSGERLHVDHDHVTGQVRELLCKKCNTALGLVDDDVDRLIALAMYLIKHRETISA